MSQLSSSPVMTAQESDAYKKLSQAWAEIERQQYGYSVVDDPRVKTAIFGLEWTTAFQFALTIQKFLSDPQTQAILQVVAPQLAQELIKIETATGTFLAQARALLDGILGGLTPVTGTTVAPGGGGGIQPVIRMGIASGVPGSTVGAASVSGGAPDDGGDEDDTGVEFDDEGDQEDDDTILDDDWEEEDISSVTEGTRQTGSTLQPGDNPDPADVVNPIPGPPPVGPRGEDHGGETHQVKSPPK